MRHKDRYWACGSFGSGAKLRKRLATFKTHPQVVVLYRQERRDATLLKPNPGGRARLIKQLLALASIETFARSQHDSAQ